MKKDVTINFLICVCFREHMCVVSTVRLSSPVLLRGREGRKEKKQRKRERERRSEGGLLSQRNKDSCN